MWSISGGLDIWKFDGGGVETKRHSIFVYYGAKMGLVKVKISELKSVKIELFEVSKSNLQTVFMNILK